MFAKAPKDTEPRKTVFDREWCSDRAAGQALKGCPKARNPTKRRMDDARARAAAFLEGSRVIQVVPGQRVRVSLRYAAATAGILVILAAAKVGESGSSKSRERLATVRARPDSVQSYEPSATDTAIRGVADRIWQTDRYRSEMMQSFFVWLVCAPLVVLAIYLCRKHGPCRAPERDPLAFAKGPSVPLARATYGATATVVPAEVVDEAGSDADALPAASRVDDSSGDEDEPEEESSFSL